MKLVVNLVENADCTSNSLMIIKNVDFSNCNLEGANMNVDGLETCNFNGVTYDETTIWKVGFDYIEHCKHI